jgi:putative DNA primase/helicase
MTDSTTPVVLGVSPVPVWENVPAELASRQQWLLWKFEAKEGAAKPGKIPYYVMGGRRTGGQGDDRDRARLATLPVVKKAFERGGWSGIGFAFLPDDGLIGIDIDGAIDLETGAVSERCAAIIKACASFTEYSPSGKGVHIIVQGTTETNKSNDIGLEVFCGRQFFTFTARRYPDTVAEVRPIEEAVLKRLHATINEAKMANRSKPPAALAKGPPAGKQPVAGAQRDDSGADDFKRVNEAAMQALHGWVPSLFPQAITKGQGYRVTSKALGRSLQEDLSIMPDGIVDFGVADMGDAKQGRRTPIDLVMEWLPAAKAKDALHWLAQRLGIALVEQPSRQKPRRAKDPASAGETEDAGGGGSRGGSGGGSGAGGGDDEGDAYEHLFKKRGVPVDCRENVMYCLQLDRELQGIVKQNDFTHLIERSRPTPWGNPAGEWDEQDDLMLGEFLLRKYGLGCKAASTLRNGVIMAARNEKYNPVHDLIRAETWDGEPRLEHWLTDVFEIDERPYTRLIGKCFIMGMVKRALQPGCKFDYMLIIKGEQGLKKSTAFRVLAQPFFTDNAIRMGDKDSLMTMQLVWIAESAELESLNKSETTQIKQFLSAQEDMFRPPYGSQLIRAKRHSVNVGTTNADEFLKDATGDRRFWPLEVKVVNEDVLVNMRLQLFAEALHRLEQGEQYWPTRDEERRLVFPEQEPFKRTDAWEDLIDAYVNRDFSEKNDDPNQPVNAKREFFSRTEIYDRALLIKADRIDGAGNMDTRIGNAMRALGFDKHRETVGKRRRGFLRRPPPEAMIPPDSPFAPMAAPNNAAGDSPEALDRPPASDDDLPL